MSDSLMAANANRFIFNKRIKNSIFSKKLDNKVEV